MNKQYNRNLSGPGMATAMSAVLAVTLALALPASAQRGAGRRGNGGQFGGGQGGAQFGGAQGGPMMRMQRPKPTLATIPVSAMTPYFNLTDEQAAKIEEMQKAARAGLQDIANSVQSMRTQATANGGQPDRQQIMTMVNDMQTKMTQVRADQDKAAQEIGKVLNSEQRPAIPSFLRDVDILQQVGLPLELIKPLALSSPQKQKLQRIAEESDTERQQKMQEAFMTMRRNGGPGGQPAATPTDPNTTNGQAATTNGAGGPGGAGFAAIGQAMQSLQEEIKQRAMAILSTDQQALVTKFEKDHPNASRAQAFGGFGGFGAVGGAAGRGAAPGAAPNPGG